MKGIEEITRKFLFKYQDVGDYQILTPLPRGNFLRHLHAGRGSKMSRPQQNLPKRPIFDSFDCTSPLSLHQHYLSAGWHISAKNTSVTRMLVKAALQFRLTYLNHHSVAKESMFHMKYVSTKFRGFLVSTKLLK